jgi:hypothetical protein
MPTVLAHMFQCSRSGPMAQNISDLFCGHDRLRSLLLMSLDNLRSYE